MKKLRWKKFLTVALVIALLVSGIPASGVQAKSKISLNRKKVTLYVGKSVKLKLKGTKAKVKWSSSKKKIATVSKKGLVKAKKKGTCKITAKSLSKKYVCKVTVKKKSVKKPTVTPVTVVSVTPTAAPTQKPGESKPTPTPKPTPKPTLEPTPTPKPNVPRFSSNSGNYDKSFDLTMTAPEGSTIYYTTDGSIPLSKEESQKGEDTEFSLTADNEEFGGSNMTTE